jgi:DNA-binding transcriptional MocR family regulator
MGASRVSDRCGQRCSDLPAIGGTGTPRRDARALAAGDQLPTLRDVVDALAINPNTVVKAYAGLESEGLVVRRQGMGTFVTAAPPAGALVAPRALRQSILPGPVCWDRR